MNESNRLTHIHPCPGPMRRTAQGAAWERAPCSGSESNAIPRPNGPASNRVPWPKPPHHTAAALAVVGLLMGHVAGTLAGGPAPTPPDKRSDKKLGERLLRRTTQDSDEDAMANILRMMQESSHRLEIDFDAGDQTQTLQRRILQQLDDTIKEAALHRRTMPRQSPSSQSDKRKRSKNKKDPSGKAARAKEGEQKDAASSNKQNPRGAEPTENAPSQGELREGRRGWGNLPQRERDEVRQGASESHLQRYRAWIERYYRALQDAE